MRNRPADVSRSARTRWTLPALASSLAAALAAGLVTTAAPAAAEHTDDPAVVTLVGSLQSELGCAADWDPACADTALEPSADGAVWSSTFDVPAGDYAYKVALNGSFEENYGAGGAADGADIPLVLGDDATLRVSYDHATHRVAVAPADAPPGLTPEDGDLAGTSLREDLTRERFYFAMADRFDNGDPSNDTGGIEGDRLDHGFDPTHKGFYHGGDLAGLLDRLDYIEGLGTTAIWLTPSFKNRPVQGLGTDFVSAGYHGYWITDFTQIDPHLGTNEELEQLVDAAHARGMKVFFDIITNHTADVIDYEEGVYGYISKADVPYRDADGDVFDDRDYAGTETFPPLDAETSFPYTPVFPTESDATVKVPDWLNDRTLYHNRGNARFDGGESDEYGDFFGLDDLFTEHPDVVDGMNEIYETWVDFGIDGFRIDTVKHVNIEFWQEFSSAILERAAKNGNDDFFAFGEVFDADPRKTSRYTTEGTLQATLDFGFQSRAAGFGNSRPTTELRDFFAQDDYYTDADSNAYSLPTFLGNHDMGRIGKFLADGAAGGADDAELLARDELVHALMYLTRGQPVVYYGDEQGFVGDGGDQDARQDMFPSQVASYNDDDLIGTDATTAEENFDTDHPLYRHLAELAELRERHPTLADGAQIHRYASNEAGVYAFSRISADDDIEYVVATNNSEQEQTASFETFRPRTFYRGVWPQRTRWLRSDAEGRVTVTVPPLSAVVWKALRPLRDTDEAPELYFRTPVEGGTVGGRAEVGVAVPDGGFNQVTLAWRPVGTEDWTALGTDDNAPYRVFHDVTGLAHGTLVEYRAVLRDSSGNLAVASTHAVVGDPPPDDGGGDGGPVVQPDAVSVPGSHNSEMGCAEDWQPGCDQAQLAFDEANQVWKGTFDLPAGQYEYKVAIDRAWDENYGAGGQRDGANIPLDHPGGAITFYYSHGTHWVTTDVQDPIVTAPGSFQSELGCAGDWLPECMRSWLQDPDGDGVYTFLTTAIPAGSYEVKVAHGLSWEENYGAGGEPGGANIGFSVPSDGLLTTFSYDVATHVLTVSTSQAGAAPDLGLEKAHWLAREVIAWDLPEDARGLSYRLHWAPAGGLEPDAEAVTGGSSAPLTRDPAGLPERLRERFPHLAELDALRLDQRTARKVEDILTGQVAVAAYDDLGRLVDATGLQLPGVLDDVYAGAADAELGLTWRGGTPSFALWAPTAKDVDLLLWAAGAEEARRVQLRRDDDGVWSAIGSRGWPRGWDGASYAYEVDVYVASVGSVLTNVVTDPYSLALTANSERSVVVDLDDPVLKPRGWDRLAKPGLAAPEDSAIYELHVRDFSVTDQTVPAAHRGTYQAFTHDGSDGMRHLRDLARAGLNTVHLLPAFDIATIEERRALQEEPPCDLASFPPDSAEQQACVEQVRDTDGFNWGYDPYHYTSPEGSYSTDPDGTVRNREFRQMVAALNGSGLRVVMDVVYNHTAATGQDPKSVLDRIVPGYYHRLGATGEVETSTCCPNTATEHRMMGKLMVDSVLTWATDYKVDGFRFDLMGHHSKQNMLDVRAALDALTVEEDGIDGSEVYVYGEGWNFGEVADDARFVQATQLNMAGTGIGTFSDRLRDAVRGGGPFDENPRVQGFGSGLWSDPNGDDVNGTPQQQRERLEHAMDLIKVGLTGNLRDYTFIDRTGATVTGADVDYNGSPAGYTADPSEVVTYVDAHDNETLYDALAFKLPQETPMADRVRMNVLSLSTVALGQGVSFWHAGSEILRSKSLDRNSYNSGDWFNRLDYTYRSNNFGVGLPPATDNADKWPYMRPLLADPNLRPARSDIVTAKTRAEELLAIRYSSPLFRLGEATSIQDKLSFPVPSNASPGVIVMLLDDTVGPDVDERYTGMAVVWNATPEEVTQEVPDTAGDAYALHPVQAGGTDDVVRESTYDAATGAFTVPARSVAVFVTG